MRSPRSRVVRMAAAAAAAATVTALAALSAPAYAEDPDTETTATETTGTGDESAEPTEGTGEESTGTDGENAKEGEGEPTDGTDEPTDETPEPPGDGTMDDMATGANLAVDLSAGESTADSWSKFLTVTVTNAGPETAVNTVVTFTVDDVSAVGIEAVDDRCTAAEEGAGVVFACVIGDLKAGGTNNDLQFDFWHAVDAEAGPVAEGTVAVASDTEDPDAADNSDPFTLSVVEAGADVSVWVAGELTADPGKTTSFSGRDFMRIDNESETEVQGLAFSMTLPPYAAFEPDYAECTYSDDGRKMNCELPDVFLEPGSGLGRFLPFTDEHPLRITVAGNAPGPLSLGSGTATVTALEALTPQVVTGKASEGAFGTTMDAAEDKSPGDNDIVYSLVTTENPADLAVTATKAKGAVGDTVEVTISIANNGPADSPKGATVTFTAPEGTTVVGGPSDCEAASDGSWVCRTDATLPVGATGDGAFELRIDAEDVGEGSVSITSDFTDADESNNTAKVVVEVVSGGGGGLPVTGTSLTIAGVAALALLVAGGALVLAGRKRKTSVAGIAADTDDAPDVPAAADGDGDDGTDEGEKDDA